jgi:hypothetical protein
MTIAINEIIVIMITVPGMSVAFPVAYDHCRNRQQGQDDECHRPFLSYAQLPYAAFPNSVAPCDAPAVSAPSAMFFFIAAIIRFHMVHPLAFVI